MELQLPCCVLGNEERWEACSRVAMVIPHYLPPAERFVCRGLTAYDCVAASSNNSLFECVPAQILHCRCACTCTCVLHTILLMVCFNLTRIHVLIPRGADEFLSCVVKWIWISKSNFEASFVEGVRREGGRKRAQKERKENAVPRLTDDLKPVSRGAGCIRPELGCLAERGEYMITTPLTGTPTPQPPRLWGHFPAYGCISYCWLMRHIFEFEIFIDYVWRIKVRHWGNLEKTTHKVYF